MDSPALRAHLDRELAAYAEGLGRVDTSRLWAAPVPSCPGWAIRDLTHHLIGLHYWVTDAINGGTGREFGPPMPSDDELTRAFLTSAAMLQQALDRDPRTACWTFVGDAPGGGTVGFWQRRQPHEHAIHRWDLDAALGVEPSLDAELSADGIDEVVSMFWPRQVALGRATDPGERVEIRPSDADTSWLLGSLSSADPPVASLSGISRDVLLALWKRIPLDHRDLHWSGNAAAGSNLLALKIVP